MASTPLSATPQGGGYGRGNSPLHAAAPRAKILLAFALIVAAGTGGGPTLLGLALICHLGLWLSGAGWGAGWKRLGAFKYFLCILGGVPLFLTPGTPLPLYGEIPLPITLEGLQGGALAVSRLALLVWISMILMHTTRPETLIETLTRAGSGRAPGGRKPFKEIFLVAVLAFQVLPRLFTQAETRLAQAFDPDAKQAPMHRIETVRRAVHTLIEWTVSVLSDSRGSCEPVPGRP